MKKFNLKEHIAKNKATFYSSLQENESTKTSSVGKTFFVTKGDESMDIKPGKYTIVKSYTEDEEKVYDIKGEDNKTITVTQDYIHGKGYWKNSPLTSKDMKESKLRSKIKEMILAELAESNIDINDTTGEYDFLAEEDYDRDRDAKAMGYRNAEEADEDNWGLPKDNEENPEASLNEEEEEEEVEVEDTEETEDVEVNTDEVDPTIKAVQDALAQAQAAAQKLGDEKLTDQIGNTITFFTRAHVSNPQQDNLMENNQPLFPMLKKILK